MLLALYAYVSQDRAIHCYLDLWQYVFTVCLTSKEIMSVQLEYLTFELGCLAVDHKKNWEKNPQTHTSLKNLLVHVT